MGGLMPPQTPWSWGSKIKLSRLSWTLGSSQPTIHLSRERTRSRSYSTSSIDWRAVLTTSIRCPKKWGRDFTISPTTALSWFSKFATNFESQTSLRRRLSTLPSTSYAWTTISFLPLPSISTGESLTMLSLRGAMLINRPSNLLSEWSVTPSRRCFTWSRSKNRTLLCQRAQKRPSLRLCESWELRSWSISYRAEHWQPRPGKRRLKRPLLRISTTEAWPLSSVSLSTILLTADSFRGMQRLSQSRQLPLSLVSTWLRQTFFFLNKLSSKFMRKRKEIGRRKST